MDVGLRCLLESIHGLFLVKIELTQASEDLGQVDVRVQQRKLLHQIHGLLVKSQDLGQGRKGTAQSQQQGLGIHLWEKKALKFEGCPAGSAQEISKQALSKSSYMGGEDQYTRIF